MRFLITFSILLYQIKNGYQLNYTSFNVNRKCFSSNVVEYVCMPDKFDCFQHVEKMKVEIMRFKCSSECSRVVLDFEAFIGSKEIHTLNMSSLGIQNLEFLSTPENYIKTFDASNNEFSKIPRLVLKAMPNLIEINLSENQIFTVEKETFVTLHYLETLNLNYNEVKRIDDNLFAYNKKLTHLYLKKNDIKYFNPGEMLKLKTLNLGFNKIETIDKILTHYNELELLTLMNNPLKTFNFNEFSKNLEFVDVLLPSSEILELDISCQYRCHFKQFNPSDNFVRIEKFSAAGNTFQNLSEILNKLGKNLKYLDLSSIQISSKERLGRSDDHRKLCQADIRDIFSIFPNLETLILMANGITEVDSDLFKNNQHLRTLDLIRNPMTHFDFNIFPVDIKFIYVYLSAEKIVKLNINCHFDKFLDGERFENLQHLNATQLDLNKLTEFLQKVSVNLETLQVSPDVHTNLKETNILSKFRKLRVNNEIQYTKSIEQTTESKLNDTTTKGTFKGNTIGTNTPKITTTTIKSTIKTTTSRPTKKSNPKKQNENQRTPKLSTTKSTKTPKTTQLPNTMKSIINTTTEAHKLDIQASNLQDQDSDNSNVTIFAAIGSIFTIVIACVLIAILYTWKQKIKYDSRKWQTDDSIYYIKNSNEVDDIFISPYAVSSFNINGQTPSISTNNSNNIFDDSLRIEPIYATINKANKNVSPNFH